MKVFLAGNREDLISTAYPTFRTAGWDNAGIADSADQVFDMVEMGAALVEDGETFVAVVAADLWPTVDDAVQAVARLCKLCQVVIVLPSYWDGEKERFTGVLAGFIAPVSWHTVAGSIQAKLVASKAPAPAPAVPAPGAIASTQAPAASTPARAKPAPAVAAAQEEPEHAPVPVPAPSEPYSKRIVALWSGPAGGTGRTTLALALAMLAAERGLDVGLLALAEPALSAYLKLPRTPNVMAFLDEGKVLTAARQTAVWQVPDSPSATEARLHIHLGPPKPALAKKVEDTQVKALVEAAHAAYDLVVIDLPALTPGPYSPWLASMGQATDIALVCPPTSAGVVAMIEALGTLEDLGVGGTIHLVMNHRAQGAPVSDKAVLAGVKNLWGDAPPVASSVPFCLDLPKAMEAGAPLEATGITEPLTTLAGTVAGVPLPAPVVKPARKAAAVNGQE
ncbi:MAG: hypothetical protein JW910_12130, partial [Anaerolineae bacterium]|nr:hypothetical protein [Anaerolineae bacterium]